MQKIQMGGVVRLSLEEAQKVANMEPDVFLLFEEIAGYPLEFMPEYGGGTTSDPNIKGIWLRLSSKPIPWDGEERLILHRDGGYGHDELDGMLWERFNLK